MAARKKKPVKPHPLLEYVDEYVGVIGVDMSMTKTGIAIRHFDTGEIVTGRVGSGGASDDSHVDRWRRFNTLHSDFLKQMPDGAGRHVFVIEEPTYTSGGSGFDRAHAWWKMVDHAMRQGWIVLVVNNSHGKIYLVGRASGSGVNKIEKGELLAAAIKTYNWVDIIDDNVADAMAMCAIGCRMVGRPIEEFLPQTHLRAIDGVAKANGIDVGKIPV